jgi:hypothetical protein
MDTSSLAGFTGKPAVKPVATLLEEASIVTQTGLSVPL